jgi:5-methylcytosine-specific restriction enzyme subunit McrC
LNDRFQRSFPEFAVIPVTEHGSADALSRREADQLIDLKAHFGCKNSREWFRFHNSKTFKAGGWAGVINLGRAQITITPKIDRPGTDGRVDLIKMLIGAGWVEDEAYGVAQLEQQDFLEIFAQWYGRRLHREATRGLPHSYVPRAEALGTLRGRLNIGRQVLAIAAGRATLACDYDAFEADTPLNQTLKAGLRAALSLSRTSTVRSQLRNTLALLDHVSDRAISPEAASRITLRRNEHGFRPLLALARLFLSKKSPQLQGAEQGQHAFGLMFSMWKLYEDYALKRLNLALAKLADPSGATYFAKGQERQRHLAKYLEHGQIEDAFQVKPDIILYRRARPGADPVPVLIADTKWKDLEEDREAATLGVAQGDAYQLFAYSHLYTEKGEPPLPLALLYPTVGDRTGTLPGQAAPTNLLGMLGEPKRTFYLDNENETAKEPKEFDGVPLHIYDFPLPALT